MAMSGRLVAGGVASPDFAAAANRKRVSPKVFFDSLTASDQIL